MINCFGHDIANVYVVDIESDDLSAKYNINCRVYLIGLLHVTTNVTTLYSSVDDFNLAVGKLVDPVFVFHNASFDVPALRIRGARIDNYYCTMVGSHTLYPESSEYHSLGSLQPDVKKSLRELLTEAGYDFTGMKKGDEYALYGTGYHDLDEYVREYLRRDLQATRNEYVRQVHEYSLDTLPTAKLRSLLLDVNLPYIERIIDMERGISVTYDGSVANVLSEAIERSYKACISIAGYVGNPDPFPAGRVPFVGAGFKAHGDFCKMTLFNPNSGDQVASKLQSLYGWKPKQLTKGGKPATSSEVLETLDYPLCEHLLEHNKATKLLSFCDALKDMVCVRPSYNQCATRTTRLSSSNPNIQQIPARDNVGKQLRKMFTAREGYSLVIGDQSGFQLRIVAAYMSYYFGDGRLAECFNRGEDVHQFFADIYGVPRNIAKNCLDYTYTKVLTPSGWVWLHAIKVGDTVMGYDSSTHTQQWTKVVDVVDGGIQQCYKFGVGARTVHSTANHDWVVGREVGSGSNRPFRHDGKLPQQVIHDSRATHRKVLHTAKYNGGKYTPVPLGKYNVDWVSWVISASTEQRESFLQGFFLADGCYSQGTRCITQNAGNILDAIQLCWHLLGGQSSMTSHSKPYQGKNSAHQCYNLRLIERQHTTHLSMCMSDEYAAHVGCLVTECGSFVIRDTETQFITITGNCTFGWLFGAGVAKMTATANRGNPNPIKESVIRDALHALTERMPAMPGVKELFIESAHSSKGVIHDWLGTRYVIPELLSTDKSVRASGERKVCNYMVQGFEASLFRKLQNLAAMYVESYDGRQALAAHDEAGYEVPTTITQYVIPHLNRIMSPAFSEFTPEVDDVHGLRLECEFNVGDTWYDAKG